MKIIVAITDGQRTYAEDVTEYQKEYFDKISTDGANPELSTFEHWTRKLGWFDFTTENLEKYNTKDNNCHFIFGWCESFAQSDDVPNWMTDSDVKLQISVNHVY